MDIRYYNGVDAKAKGRCIFETLHATSESLAFKIKREQMTNLSRFEIKFRSVILEGRASAKGVWLLDGQTQKYITDPEKNY